jgi:hypothetical protein
MPPGFDDKIDPEHVAHSEDTGKSHIPSCCLDFGESIDGYAAKCRSLVNAHPGLRPSGTDELT